ncbi:MAG: hypothetical protein EBZ49_00285 [Proteobacteria bacterium]|nr:hypothetical protein [Pseudomonadota bacterium]
MKKQKHKYVMVVDYIDGKSCVLGVEDLNCLIDLALAMPTKKKNKEGVIGWGVFEYTDAKKYGFLKKITTSVSSSKPKK